MDCRALDQHSFLQTFKELQTDRRQVKLNSSTPGVLVPLCVVLLISEGDFYYIEAVC